MPEQTSRTAREIASVPDALRVQEAMVGSALRELVRHLKRRAPQLVVSCARGSSAHAATFGKHLIERHLGLPVCAAAPSIASIYDRELRLRDQLVLAISQSGASDDLIAFARSARRAGAFTVAVTNDEHSALAATCELVLPLAVGSEQGIAATKTFIATLALLSRLVAAWADDEQQEVALSALPDHLSAAMQLDWSAAVEALSTVDSMATIGRGPTLAIAREAALKLKETCNLHAEAFSGAEFMHGPVTLASQRYPILMFMPWRDPAQVGMQNLAAALANKGVLSLVAAAGGCPALPAIDTGSPALDAICLTQSFYCTLVRLAARRGCSIDSPPNLQKITRTR